VERWQRSYAETGEWYRGGGEVVEGAVSVGMLILGGLAFLVACGYWVTEWLDQRHLDRLSKHEGGFRKKDSRASWDDKSELW